jgi:hypothetical protein
MEAWYFPRRYVVLSAWGMVDWDRIASCVAAKVPQCTKDAVNFRRRHTTMCRKPAVERRMKVLESGCVSQYSRSNTAAPTTNLNHFVYFCTVI